MRLKIPNYDPNNSRWNSEHNAYLFCPFTIVNVHSLASDTFRISLRYLQMRLIIPNLSFTPYLHSKTNCFDEKQRKRKHNELSYRDQK